MDLEELILRIGEAEPTQKQREKLRRLAREISELKEQLEALETEEAPEVEDKSFTAKWKRLRIALQDFAQYDLNDGMLRIVLGIKFQIDATFVSQSEKLKDGHRIHRQQL